MYIVPSFMCLDMVLNCVYPGLHSILWMVGNPGENRRCTGDHVEIVNLGIEIIYDL